MGVEVKFGAESYGLHTLQARKPLRIASSFVS